MKKYLLSILILTAAPFAYAGKPNRVNSCIKQVLKIQRQREASQLELQKKLNDLGKQINN